jgi:hypothetical protein
MRTRAGGIRRIEPLAQAVRLGRSIIDKLLKDDFGERRAVHQPDQQIARVEYLGNGPSLIASTPKCQASI